MLFRSARPGQPVRAREGALVDAAAIVGRDVVDASAGGEGVGIPHGALCVEELQLRGAGERAACGAGRGVWYSTRTRMRGRMRGGHLNNTALQQEGLFVGAAKFHGCLYRREDWTGKQLLHVL